MVREFSEILKRELPALRVDFSSILELDTMVNAPEDLSAYPIADKIHRIVLTGFMGAGKSTVGRLLADCTGWKFLDLDNQIEKTTGKNARQLFEDLGETRFRQLESDLLGTLLRQSKAIIAPGGAVIDKYQNEAILAGSPGSFVVFLDAPFQTLIDRCLQQELKERCTYRPLLHKTRIARERYVARKALYMKHAHRIVNVADKSPQRIARIIWQAVLEMRDTTS